MPQVRTLPSPRRAPGPSARRRALALTLFVGLLTAPAALRAEEGEGTDPQGTEVTLVLGDESGTEVPATLLAEDAAHVEVRIGDGTYRFERARLRAVLDADGSERLDPRLVAAVTRHAEDLASPVELVREAARTALEFLGEAAGERMGEILEAMPDRRLRQAAAGAAGHELGPDMAEIDPLVDQIMGRIEARMKVDDAQRIPLREAMTAFVISVRSGEERARALATLRERLGGFLRPAQMKAMFEDAGGGG